jgi:hypothetical protein
MILESSEYYARFPRPHSVGIAQPVRLSIGNSREGCPPISSGLNLGDYNSNGWVESNAPVCWSVIRSQERSENVLGLSRYRICVHELIGEMWECS